MINATVGGVDFKNTLKLILAERKIGTPEPRRLTTEVPGRDGLLDMTIKMYGKVPYDNRTITLTFITLEKLSGMAWHDTLERVMYYTHGKEVKVIFSDDTEHYYKGWCSVAGETKNGLQTITLTIDAEPYRYTVAGDSAGW